MVLEERPPINRNIRRQHQLAKTSPESSSSREEKASLVIRVESSVDSVDLSIVTPLNTKRTFTEGNKEDDIRAINQIVEDRALAEAVTPVGNVKKERNAIQQHNVNELLALHELVPKLSDT